MIQIWIVTYNNPVLLKDNLDSLFSSDADPSTYKVNIINNFGLVFTLPEEYKDRVIVHHQTLRPDWSSGHLTKDWNAAIVNGFVDLNNPWCDQLILCQDDTLWKQNWQSTLNKIHKKYNLYIANDGDGFISMTADAVKKVGLFDERFSVISHHDADFILRAYLWNRDQTTCNDRSHGRQFNETELVVERWRENEKYQNLMRSRALDYTGSVSLVMWQYKWGKTKFRNWHLNPPEVTTPLVATPITYPYFEKGIEKTREKGYLHAGYTVISRYD